MYNYTYSWISETVMLAIIYCPYSTRRRRRVFSFKKYVEFFYRLTMMAEKSISSSNFLMNLGYFDAASLRATVLMQYRFPVGGGPSSKTWPRCAPQRAQTTSSRCMPKLSSTSILTLRGEIGSKKLGQPVPDSNLLPYANKSVPQPTHW